LNRPSFLLPAALLLALNGLAAQTPPATGTEPEVIELSPFVVSAGETEGYIASESITGSRIRTPIRDLPFNIDVVTAEFITDFDTIELMEAVAHTSGLVGSDITPAQMTSRGFSQAPLKDGMSFFGLLTRSSIDRVEIIKGPFAAIYGKTQPGGLVNFISKRPGNRHQQTINLSAGSMDYRRVAVSSTGPIIKNKLMYRIDGGYYEKSGTQEYKWFEQEELAMTLLYRFTEGTSLSVEVNHLDNIRSRGAPVLWERDPVTQQYTRKLTERFFFNRDGPGGEDGVHFNWKYKSLTSHFEHRFNSVFSTRLSGVWWERNQPSVSLSGSAFVPPGGTTITARHPSWGLIARDCVQIQGDLLATYRTGPIEHTSLLSFSFQNETEAQSQHLLPTALRADPSINRNTTDMDNPIWFYPHPSVRPELFTLLNQDRSGEFEIKSVFFTHRMELMNRRLKLFFGGRYDEVKNELFDHRTGLATSVPATDFSPQAGLNYTIAPRVAFYASYSESYTPRTQVQSSTQELLPNENGQGVDIGFKSTWFGGRLNIVTGVYAIERNNVLQSYFDEDLSRNVLDASGQVKTDGIEVDLNWQLTDSLQILAGWGLTDNRITRNPERPDLEGKPAARGVAPYNYGVRMVYRFQGERLKGLSLRASVRGQGKSIGEFGNGAYTRGGIQYENDNRANVWQPGFTVVDVGAGYGWRTKGSRWRHRISVNFKNIFDETYSIGNWNPQDRFSSSFTYSLSRR